MLKFTLTIESDNLEEIQGIMTPGMKAAMTTTPPAGTRAPAPKPNGNGSAAGPQCPTHKTARPGKKGFFCPVKLDSGEFCTWTG